MSKGGGGEGPHKRFVCPRKQGLSLFLPCILVSYKNGCPKQAKCSCCLSLGGLETKHPFIVVAYGYIPPKGQKCLKSSASFTPIGPQNCFSGFLARFVVV